MSLLDNVYNYYEKMVIEILAGQCADQDFDEDFLLDVLCVALNQLPSRYFRHGVDMAFFLSSEDYRRMEQQVHEAVTAAIEHVRNHARPG